MRLRQLATAFVLGWFHWLAVGFTPSHLLPRPNRDITTVANFQASSHGTQVAPGNVANLD
jgi:predicted thioesterase